MWTPTVYSGCIMYTVMYAVHYKVYSVHCTLYNSHCTLYNGHCTYTKGDASDELFMKWKYWLYRSLLRKWKSTLLYCIM